MPISMSAAARTLIAAVSALFATGYAHGQAPGSAAATVALAPPPSSVSAAGFSLTSTKVDLPDSERMFPDGPGMDVTQQNCTACHSVGMVMNQPNLPAAVWSAEVNKMRLVYKAPIDAADIPVIVNYLISIKGSR